MQQSGNRSEAFPATCYASLTDEQLYCLFTEEKWLAIDAQRRLAALQEIEIRMAVKQKRKPCKVCCKMLGDIGNQGVFDGNQIVINTKLLMDFKTPFGKHTGLPGIMALDTVLHEGRHAFQTGITTGMIDSKAAKVSDEQRRIWAINELAYIGGELSEKLDQGFSMYAFQPIERDAREFAGRELAKIYQTVIRATGKRDPMFEEGIAELRRLKKQEFEVAANMKKENIDQMREAMRMVFSVEHLTRFGIAYMGEAVTVNFFMAINGIKADMINDLIDAQTKNIRDIVDGKKKEVDYMDGLDEESFSEALDAKIDSGRKKTLAELAGQILKPKPDSSGVRDGSSVKIDGKKKGF